MGHSLIWNQILQLHTPVDDLRQQHPDIADKFTILSKKLEGAGSGSGLDVGSYPHQQSVVTSSENFHALADERAKLVDHIRGLDGFDQFLLPSTFSQLQLAACNGPVICINVSQLHCDALILLPGVDDILHVPLKKFTYKASEALYQWLKVLLGR
jgi:hypothetical protein